MEDYLVAAVAVGVGSTILLAAIQQWGFMYQLPTVQRVHSWWGEGATRLLLLGLGALLILLGGAIAAGWTRQAARGGHSPERGLSVVGLRSS